MMPGYEFSEVWVVDTEYRHPTHEPIEQVHCACFREVNSGQEISLWGGQLEKLPPQVVGPQKLVVAFQWTAEASAYDFLGWDKPDNAIDLYVENLWMLNGHPTWFGTSLFQVLQRFGIQDLDHARKEDTRELCIRGAPFTEAESQQIIEYCRDDVRLTCKLFEKMSSYIDWPRARMRAQFMQQVAEVERVGVPLDVVTYELFDGNWDAVRYSTAELGGDLGVYEGTSLRQSLLEEFVVRHGIRWPRTSTGRLSISDETMRTLANIYPKVVGPLYDIHATLRNLPRFNIPMGRDGRSRARYWPFGTVTGRNATKEFIFGKAKYLRSLIQPTPGYALSYIDWAAQEICIGAHLSGDEKMIQAYDSDPYLSLAKAGRYALPHATKSTHRGVRDQFKIVYLAANYRMGAETLARSLGIPTHEAKSLLTLIREEYSRFWRWSSAVTSRAYGCRQIYNSLGWQMQVNSQTKSTTLANWPMQSCGASMLHLTMILLRGTGVSVVAMVHDAVMIEAPVAEIAEAERVTKFAMEEASRMLLNGGTCRAEVEQRVEYPNRYKDERGYPFFSHLLAQLGAGQSVSDAGQIVQGGSQIV